MSLFYRLLPTTTSRVVLARLQSSSKSGSSPTSGPAKGGFSGGSATSSSTMGTTSSDPDMGRSSSSTIPAMSGASGATSTGQAREPPRRDQVPSSAANTKTTTQTGRSNTSGKGGSNPA